VPAVAARGVIADRYTVVAVTAQLGIDGKERTVLKSKLGRGTRRRRQGINEKSFRTEWVCSSAFDCALAEPRSREAYRGIRRARYIWRVLSEFGRALGRVLRITDEARRQLCLDVLWTACRGLCLAFNVNGVLKEKCRTRSERVPGRLGERATKRVRYARAEALDAKRNRGSNNSRIAYARARR
jgi:hypothetical protein